MKRLNLAIALSCAVAFSMPVLAKPLRKPVQKTAPIVQIQPKQNYGEYAEVGLSKAIEGHLILGTGEFARKLRYAVTLLKSQSVSEVSAQTGIKTQVLERLIKLGTPIPSILSAAVGIPAPLETSQPIERQPVQEIPQPKEPEHDLSGQRFVEGWGLEPLENNTFQKLKKLKWKKFLLVDSFLDQPAKRADDPNFTGKKFVEGWGIGPVRRGAFKLSAKVKVRKFGLAKSFLQTPDLIGAKP